MSSNRDNHNAGTQLGASAAAKVAELLATVQAFAAFDFSRRAAAGSGDGVLDELAEAINTLGENVQATHDQLESRVEERTRRLTELAGELEAELHERRSSETALRETNERLIRSVEELERAKREIEQLTEMSNLLQVCSDRNEAFSVLGYVGPNLFPDTAGTVYLFLASRDVLKPLASWGPDAGSGAKINPEACWALRRGRPHHSGPYGLRCSHLPEGDTDEALCVPLMAQGVTTGLLHLSWAARPDDPPGGRAETKHSYTQLAVAASEQIALALANLDLKEALEVQSIRDPLTGLYNRRYLEETLSRELRRAQREDACVAFVMIDIDHFKRFNDVHGHDVEL